MSRCGGRSWATALVTLLISAAAVLLTLAAPAAAACAMPAPSAVAFSGTVVRVREDGTVARVQTDDGRVVTVRGASPGAAGADDVRRFAVTGRYEFRPRTASDPYQDDACTATRQVSGPAYRPSMNTTDAGPGARLALGGGLVALLLCAPWLARRLHRRR